MFLKLFCKSTFYSTAQPVYSWISFISTTSNLSVTWSRKFGCFLKLIITIASLSISCSSGQQSCLINYIIKFWTWTWHRQHSQWLFFFCFCRWVLRNHQAQNIRSANAWSSYDSGMRSSLVMIYEISKFWKESTLTVNWSFLCYCTAAAITEAPKLPTCQ